MLFFNFSLHYVDIFRVDTIKNHIKSKPICQKSLKKKKKKKKVITTETGNIIYIYIYI